MSFTAHPYARAFLETAPANYDVERFLESAGSLSRAIDVNPTLRAFLTAPAVPQAAKQRAVVELATRAGLDQFGQRFFEVVLANRRILVAGEIVRSIRGAFDARQGIVRGRVTVAAPIGEDEKKTIEAALAGRVGGNVLLKVEVDPKILAGFVAHVGSNVFDASVVAAIRQFQEQVKARTGA